MFQLKNGTVRWELFGWRRSFFFSILFFTKLTLTYPFSYNIFDDSKVHCIQYTENLRSKIILLLNSDSPQKTAITYIVYTVRTFRATFYNNYAFGPNIIQKSEKKILVHCFLNFEWKYPESLLYMYVKTDLLMGCHRNTRIIGSWHFTNKYLKHSYSSTLRTQ